eukprot:2319047-Prymnesium_polylepis.1
MATPCVWRALRARRGSLGCCAGGWTSADQETRDVRSGNIAAGQRGRITALSRSVPRSKSSSQAKMADGRCCRQR